MGLDVLILLVNIIKYTTPALALCYLLIWLMQIHAPALFKIIDTYFGFLPNTINTVILVKAEIGGSEVPMGYVYSAILCISCTVFCFYVLTPKLDKLKRIQENKEIKKRVEIQKQIKKQKEKERVQKIIEKEVFFGLFELSLEYSDLHGKNSNELEKLKMEYLKIMVMKLKTKYKRINFILKDKIFFYSDDFSFFSSVTKDILRIFNIFIRANKKNHIKTKMFFSYWADERKANKKTIFSILSKINNLGFPNQILITSGIYFKIKKNTCEPWYEIFPMSTSRLENIYGDGNDLDINLLAITKTK